jgi:hypothetical protein
VQPAADIQVTAVSATTNPSGDITEAGCTGPAVDLTVTVQNFGIDFPTEEGLQQWKDLIASRQGELGWGSYEETPLMTVAIDVDFSGMIQQKSVGLYPKDLPAGGFKNGMMIDLPLRVNIPCCDPINDFTVTARTNQSSLYFLPIGDEGIKNPYQDTFTAALPDIVPGHGQIVRRDKQATVTAEIVNQGSAPTVGPVEIEVVIPDINSGFSSAIWQMRYDAPFTGTVSVGPTEVKELSGEPDLSRVNLNVRMLCPSETYDIVSDANVQNNSEERDVSVTAQSEPLTE